MRYALRGIRQRVKRLVAAVEDTLSIGPALQAALAANAARLDALKRLLPAQRAAQEAAYVGVES